MAASVIIIDEQRAHQLARGYAQDTGRPHGVAPRSEGEGWRVVPLRAAYHSRCVCGAPADGGDRLCCDCALLLSVVRGDRCPGCGESRARGETCSRLECPSYHAEVS